MEPIFTYDEEKGLTKCVLIYKGKFFEGYAKCHENDLDMKNNFTGSWIAAQKALIKLNKYYLKEIKDGLKALNQLYYSINKSKFFNENSYETKMLKRQISIHEDDIEAFKENIDMLKKQLVDVIDEKEKFYQKVRKERRIKEIETEKGILLS